MERIIKKQKNLVIFFFLLFQIINPIQAQDRIAVFNINGHGLSENEIFIITDRIIFELVQLNKYIVLERQNIDEILKEQSFNLSGCISNECLVEAGQLLGVEHIVGGSVGKIGNLYTINLRLIDVKTGKILKSVVQDIRGKIEDVLTNGIKIIVQKLSDKTRQPNNELIIYDDITSKLLQFIGLRKDNEDIINFLKGNREYLEYKKSDIFEYFTFPKLGFDIVLSLSGEVESIYFTNSYKEYIKYPYGLPFDLQFKDSRAEVLYKLGKPYLIFKNKIVFTDKNITVFFNPENEQIITFVFN